MSSTCSQTRSSIDLGVSQVHSSLQRLQADLSPRIHPARLQHSPSLPNIWFPPHSGPIPREMATNKSHDFPRSSTPPLSLRDDTPAASSSTEQHPRHFKYDPSFRNTSALPKTHARRRTERDQPHALLTPPLTPSSSIRTTASRDSAASAGVQQGCDQEDVVFKEEICDTDLDSTRFLLIGNVNRQISLEVLESIVVNALIPTRMSSDTTPTTLTSAVTTPTSRHLDSPIRGVHPRYLESEGIVPFAFFDIRHAVAAKGIICTRSVGPLELCVGDDMDDDGQRMWLTCRFVSSDELSEIIGNSKFIESSDGAFDLTVQKIYHQVELKHVDSPLEQSLEPTETINLKAADAQTSRGGINIALLHKILKSFGGVRSFTFNRQDVDNEDSVSLVYRVEYYDLREADAAFRGLDNQNMFGMKINVSGRPVNETKESDLPFPNASTAGKSFDGLSIGPAGSQSLMRMPFFQTGSPKSSASSLTSPQIVPNQGSSPPYFYSSFRGLNTLVPFNHEVGPSGQHGGPETHGTAEEPRPLERRPSNVFQEGGSGYRPDSISPCYTPDGICLYCPSRSSSVAVPFNPGYHGLPSPTPIPTLYYPPHGLPQPIANVTPWALTPVPYLRDDYIAAGHHYYPSTPDQHIVQQPSHAVAHPPVPAIPPKNSIYVSTRQSTPSSHESASSPSQFKMGTSMNNIPSGVSDRNQLNIARIEDGQDTRTTVMIKNIPNKMSHADLEAYIAKVCPRRIDFMYLRMDFQNGCNVGYAFVNFIHVQDLLRFAQQRLGEKWNMFSSEKVLQMSYANYQGKEALVEKFKNSSIMDEREAWRPRIFYSSGPDQGKPETFPAPTHLRRKERSSHNRGALYVPGVNNSGGSSTRRYQEDHQNQSPRRNHLYRTQVTR